MLTRFRHDIHAPRASYRHGEWLPQYLGGLAWRLELHGVDDPLGNPDALWDRTSGGGSGIVEARSKDSHRRLRRALADHRRWQRRDEPLKGKQVLEDRTYADLILLVPQTPWEDDLRIRNGELIALTAQNLGWHLGQAFRATLPPGRDPRCLVRPDPGLADGRVAFLFGPGVYLPHAEDSPAFQVLPSLDGAPVALASLQWPPGSRRAAQPPAFYADQECVLLTPEGQGPLPVPGWRAPEGAYLLLRRGNEDQWDAYPPREGGFRVRQRRGLGGSWTFALEPPEDGAGPLLSVAIRPAAGDAPSAAAGLTLMPGIPNNPGSPWGLELEAVALPALLPGLRQWTLWLDPAGGIAGPQVLAGDRERLAALRLDIRGLWLTRPGEPPRPLGERIAEPLDLDDSGTALLPATGLPGYLALLRLPRPDFYPLGEAALTLGRSHPNDAGGAPEISLDQLVQPGGLLWAEPHPDHTLNNLGGLSRRHTRLRVRESHLVAERLEAVRGALARLDDAYRPLSDPAPLTLAPGERLLAGNFVLRFCSEEAA